MNDTVLEIHDLTKRYGKFTAVNKLSLSVKRGQVFGLLGPNGSGKTTTLGTLLGALNATSGSFSWFGNGQTDSNRKRIGALLETPNFYPYLNAADNLKIIGKIKEVENIDERIEVVLKRVNLWDRKQFKFRHYSLGMKQRLAIASALVSDPEVLVLDEPTNGLDPQGIAEIRELIGDIAREGKTIILASHILDEVEKVCTHVAILRKGELLRQEKMEDILKQERQFRIAAEDMKQLAGIVSGLGGIEVREETAGYITVSTAGKEPHEINRQLAEKGVFLSSLTEHKKSLEKIFLEIVEE